MLWILPGIIASYLIGSIPTAYVFGRMLKGIDIRSFGSGNIGATNALRVLGRGPGIAVLAIDILKGFLPVLLIGGLILKKTGLPQELVLLTLGLSCICGHIWTIFLNFNGGKGIATTLGVLIGLAFRIGGLNIVLGLLVLTWLIVFLATRLVSLASIIGAIALPLYLIIFRQSLIMVSAGAVLALFSIYRHKENLKRILQGKEKKLSFRKSQATAIK
jgi:acyl phosphate:glycerol-3-phosphate acyltransferase